MSKLFTGSIDLSKIDKETLYTHADGRKFLNLSIWLNDAPDQFGNNMSIQQQTPKDAPKIYLGNAKEYKREERTEPKTEDLPF